MIISLKNILFIQCICFILHTKLNISFLKLFIFKNKNHFQKSLFTIYKIKLFCYNINRQYYGRLRLIKINNPKLYSNVVYAFSAFSNVDKKFLLWKKSQEK